MKPLVLVTCRDRDTHLRVFLLYMSRYFPQLTIAIIQQDDTSHWNKGLLYNAGFQLLSPAYDYVILHDIDFIPDTRVDYSYCEQPTLLSTECSQFNYGYYYEAFFGGVVGMNKTHYTLINGFSNQFKGYGGEDDSLYQSFIQKGITPVKRLGNRFENFIHPKPDIRPGTPFFHTLEYQNNLKLCTTPRDFSDGLSTTKYTVIDSIFEPHYIHIKIDTRQ